MSDHHARVMFYVVVSLCLLVLAVASLSQAATLRLISVMLVSLLDSIDQQRREAMTLLEQIKAVIAAQAARFDAATNELAADLAKLRQELRDKATGGLTEAEGQALLVDLEARLEPIASRLIELGKDPEPVPAPVEEHPAIVAEEEAAAATPVDPVADPPASDPLDDDVPL